MKKTVIFSLIPLFLQVCALSAHSHHQHVDVIVETPQPAYIAVAAPAPIIVSGNPPAPILETITAAPQANYVLIPGNWEWNGRWVWRSHKWVARPHAAAVWEPGHTDWSNHHNAYVWHKGHWK
jgi:hypothetical protein